MEINKEWHKAHKMPKNPTVEQKKEWHALHQLNCACWKSYVKKDKKNLENNSQKS